MQNSEKYFIGSILFFLAVSFCGVFYLESLKHECRLAGMEKNYSSADISAICK